MTIGAFVNPEVWRCSYCHTHLVGEVENSSAGVEGGIWAPEIGRLCPPRAAVYERWKKETP